MKLKNSQWLSEVVIVEEKDGIKRIVDSRVIKRKPRPRVDDWEDILKRMKGLAMSVYHNVNNCLFDDMFTYYDECEALALQTFFELGWQE